MKYVKAIFNIIEDLFHYTDLKNMGFTMKDIIYNEFHPINKSKRVQEIINNRNK